MLQLLHATLCCMCQLSLEIPCSLTTQDGQDGGKKRRDKKKEKEGETSEKGGKRKRRGGDKEASERPKRCEDVGCILRACTEAIQQV